MTLTPPRREAAESRRTEGFFAIVGPGRKPVGGHIEGSMICGPALHEDDDFSTVFTAAAPVRLRAPSESITNECEEAGRLGFFSRRGALMWTTKARAQFSGEPLSLPGVRVVDGP